MRQKQSLLQNITTVSLTPFSGKYEGKGHPSYSKGGTCAQTRSFSCPTTLKGTSRVSACFSERIIPHNLFHLFECFSQHLQLHGTERQTDRVRNGPRCRKRLGRRYRHVLLHQLHSHLVCPSLVH